MNKKVWIGLFFAFIMIFSIFGMVVDFMIPEQKLQYNDYDFKVKDRQVFTKINGVEHGFLFFPGDLEYISVPDEVKTLLSAPVLTVTYDPLSPIAEDLATSQYFFEVQFQDVKVVERGLTNATGTSLPERSCANSTVAQPVLELRQTDESSITVDNNCIILGAVDARDVYQMTERIIYLILGVMS